MVDDANQSAMPQLHLTCRSATVKAFIDEEPGVGAYITFSVRKMDEGKLVVDEEAPLLLEAVSLSRTSSDCLSNEASSGLATTSSQCGW